MPSKDGVVRAAGVKIQGDREKQVILWKPIQHLTPLKIQLVAESKTKSDHANENIVEDQGCTRSREQAAIATDLLRAQLDFKQYIQTLN